MSGMELTQHVEAISEEDFENCLKEIKLMEDRNRHTTEGEQGICSFREICSHCPCLTLLSGGQDTSCDVCEKQLSDNRCQENYIKKMQMNKAQGLSTTTVQESCTACKGYKLQYEQCKVRVASVRVEAEMIEAELEGLEYVRVKNTQDEACISALDEVYSSVLLRRIRLIQNFTQELGTSKPVTALRRGVCRTHLEGLPTTELLEAVISDLLMGIWRGDINYVPHLQR